MAGKIPPQFIQELLARADIVDVIQPRVPLQRAGREFKACCPFHNERTPSFFVNPAKQFFHCFGCGESGTAITFLMKYGNLQFREAVEELCLVAGMQIPAAEIEGRRVSGDFESALALMKEVQFAFRNELHRGESALPRDYLKSRCITSESADRFGLGYAPDEWDYLLKRFGSTQQERVLLEKTGLIVPRQDGNRFYDRFRGRLMFPIHDRRGRVIAFGGRIIGDGEPKYLNSPETILFKKSNELFGLHMALPQIRKFQSVILVEGYTDVIGLVQMGIDNAVATLGTATTPYHIRALFKAAPEIVFCFDGDNAGRLAAWRAMQTLLPMLVDGRLVSFVFLPQGQDPDSMVREEGKEAFLERIAKGEPVTSFILRSLQEKADLERHDGKAKLIEDFAPIYAELPESLLRGMLVEEIGSCTGVAPERIEARLNQSDRPRHSNAYRQAPDGARRGDSDRLLSTRALAVLVQNPRLGSAVKQQTHHLGDPQHPNIRLLVEILSILADSPEITTAALIERFRDSEHFDWLHQLASLRHDVADDGLEQEFAGMIQKFRLLVQEQRNQAEISALQSGDLSDDELMRIHRQIQESQQMKNRGRLPQRLH